MSITSKVVLIVSIIAAVLNVAFSGPKADWAIPVMLAISASPALRPGWLTVSLACSACTAILIAQIASKPALTKGAILLALFSMLIGLVNRGLGARAPNNR